METILLVDDDKVLRYMLREGLERNNFLIVEAANGKRSLEILQQHKTDLILLDLHLPDGNGLDFIKQIRQYTDAPLIIISGDNHKTQQIDGFDLGADDYVTKPFELDLLIAKVKANIRRYKGENANQNSNNAVQHIGEKIKFAQMTLDCTKFQLFDAQGQSCNLTAREYTLLSFLIKHAGRALKREDLCDAIREDSYIPTPRAIDVKITRIRKKIGDNAEDPQIIKTVRGIGYLFEPTSILEPHK